MFWQVAKLLLELVTEQLIKLTGFSWSNLRIDSENSQAENSRTVV